MSSVLSRYTAFVGIDQEGSIQKINKFPFNSTQAYSNNSFFSQVNQSSNRNGFSFGSSNVTQNSSQMFGSSALFSSKTTGLFGSQNHPQNLTTSSNSTFGAPNLDYVTKTSSQMFGSSPQLSSTTTALFGSQNHPQNLTTSSNFTLGAPNLGYFALSNISQNSCSKTGTSFGFSDSTHNSSNSFSAKNNQNHTPTSTLFGPINLEQNSKSGFSFKPLSNTQNNPPSSGFLLGSSNLTKSSTSTPKNETQTLFAKNNSFFGSSNPVKSSSLSSGFCGGLNPFQIPSRSHNSFGSSNLAHNCKSEFSSIPTKENHGFSFGSSNSAFNVSSNLSPNVNQNPLCPAQNYSSLPGSLNSQSSVQSVEFQNADELDSYFIKLICTQQFDGSWKWNDISLLLIEIYSELPNYEVSLLLIFQI